MVINTKMKSRKIVSLPQSILVSGCLAALLLPVGALGSKHDLWEFTTGFTIVDFTGWTEFITILFFILMFFGASAGSTSGGIKIVRHVVLLKNSYNEIKKQLHQSAIFTLKFNNNKVPQSVVTNILAFMMLYVVIFSLGSIIMTILGEDFITSIGSVAATLGNIGPGIGDVGPASNYSSISNAGKYLLSLLMFIGRLELLTFLMILTPVFWKYN